MVNRKTFMLKLISHGNLCNCYFLAWYSPGIRNNLNGGGTTFSQKKYMPNVIFLLTEKVSVICDIFGEFFWST
jgi:hypothetical protein